MPCANFPIPEFLFLFYCFECCETVAERKCWKLQSFTHCTINKVAVSHDVFIHSTLSAIRNYDPLDGWGQYLIPTVVVYWQRWWRRLANSPEGWNYIHLCKYSTFTLHDQNGSSNANGYVERDETIPLNHYMSWWAKFENSLWSRKILRRISAKLMRDTHSKIKFKQSNWHMHHLSINEHESETRVKCKLQD